MGTVTCPWTWTPVVWPRWPMSHAILQGHLTRSWLQGSLTGQIHCVLISFPKHYHQDHKKGWGWESGDLGSNPDAAMIQ